MAIRDDKYDALKPVCSHKNTTRAFDEVHATSAAPGAAIHGQSVQAIKENCKLTRTSNSTEGTSPHDRKSNSSRCTSDSDQDQHLPSTTHQAAGGDAPKPIIQNNVVQTTSNHTRLEIAPFRETSTNRLATESMTISGKDLVVNADPGQCARMRRASQQPVANTHIGKIVTSPAAPRKTRKLSICTVEAQDIELTLFRPINSMCAKDTHQCWTARTLEQNSDSTQIGRAHV